MPVAKSQPLAHRPDTRCNAPRATLAAENHTREVTDMAAMSAMGLREIRRDRGPRPPADRTSEIEMLEAYRERLLTELMEIEREINAVSR